VFWTHRGPEEAVEVVRRRLGRWFDPQVARAFLEAQADEGFWDALDGEGLDDRVASLEPADHVLACDEARLDRVASAFARVIDAKSPWTYRHSERVRAFAMGIADELGLPEQRHALLSRAALLHDLGKLGVPNTILDKPGRLTDAEFAVIRRHPADSERILRRVAPFRAFAEVAGAHHERMDGGGYHRGRPAGRLPVEARILATADPFEALTASRPYRPGLPADEALAVLRRDVGSGVDAACLSALERFLTTPAGRGLLAGASTGAAAGDGNAGSASTTGGGGS
jgi:putative nucleotidyltransferase with HDIG domain